jgi:hypothetical protein
MAKPLQRTDSTAASSIAGAFIWALAAWAISVHLAVATGASFNRLLLCTPITILVAAIGWFLGTRNPAPANPSPETSDPPPLPWFIAAALITAFWRAGFFPFWLAAILFLLTGWAWATFSKHPPVEIAPPAEPQKSNRLGLIALCGIGMLFTLLVHHPNIDDGFYVSVAADAHRHPDRPIWSTDTLHDDPHFGVFLPIYKAEAHEYLIALAAKLFHVSSIRAASSVLPPIFAIFVVLSWYTLACTINPKKALVVTALAIAVSIFAGEARLSPAAFSFVQLQEGKSVMASAIIPLICVYAFRLVTDGGWQNVVMLIVTQIAGVGLSSTAMVVGPPVACAVGFACTAWFPSEPRTYIRGFVRLTGIASSCIYPLSAALLMHGKMTTYAWIEQSEFRLSDDLVERVLGEHQSYLFLAALIGTWTVAPRRSARLLLAPGILLLGIMLNPLAFVFFQTRIFSPLIFQRVFWVVPWLVWTGILICGTGSRFGQIVKLKFPALAKPAAILCSATLLILALLWHPLWQHKHGSHVRFGGLKVEESDYAVAQRLADETPPGTAALAPEAIACWTAVQDHRPPLIFVRSYYYSDGMLDFQIRNRLGEIAAKPSLTSADVSTLSDGIHQYHLGAVVLRQDAGADAAAALTSQGFQNQPLGKYILWTRRGQP